MRVKGPNHHLLAFLPAVHLHTSQSSQDKNQNQLNKPAILTSSVSDERLSLQTPPSSHHSTAQSPLLIPAMYSLLTGSRLGCIINHASRAVTRRSSFTTHKDFTRSFRSAGKQQGQPALAEKPTHIEFLPDAPQFPESTDNLVEKNIIHSHASPARTLEREIREPHGNDATLEMPSPTVPLYHRSSKFERVPYWQKIPRWSDVSEEQFLTYSWGVSHSHSTRQG